MRIPPYILIASGTLFLCLCLARTAWLASASQPSNGPRLACDQPVFDFGEAETGTMVEHTFTLRNDGNSSLDILEVKPSCGCTVVELTEKTIPPGSSVDLRVRLSLEGRRGRQEKSLLVESTDPLQPRHRLAVEGIAVPRVKVSPRQVEFGKIDGAKPATQNLEVWTDRENFTFNILDVSSDSPDVLVDWETVSEGKAYRLRVGTRHPLLTDRILTNLRIKTDDPGDLSIVIGVSGNVTDGVPVPAVAR